MAGPAAEEKDDEEREDVPALAAAVIPASPHGDGELAETGRHGEPDPAEMENDRSGGRTAGEIASEQPGRIAEETAVPDGPVWTVRSVVPELDALGQQMPAGRMGEMVEDVNAAELSGTRAVGTRQMSVGLGLAAEPAAGARTAGTPPMPAERAVQAQAGLEGLYRQTVQAARPAAPALPLERVEGPGRIRESGSSPPPTVDELDRAVRRDSRRYDGGMSIF